MALFFQGTVQTDAKGFAINFCTGPSEGDDIAFYFNPRIGQFTALNSFKNGQWETEASAPDKPFTAGAPFYMIVVITSNDYEVYVNDQIFCMFNHRIPFEKVNTIRVVGDVSTNIIGFIENWRICPFFREEKRFVTITGSLVSASTKFEAFYSISNPALPYALKLPANLKHNMAVFFQGTLQNDAKSFAINFCTGPSEGDDIAFYFNPRMGQFTALNSFKNGQWETEESAPDKPFTAGGQFIIIFVITSNAYEVYVNGQKHCTFKCRIPFEKVTTIRMLGNIFMNLVCFIKSLPPVPQVSNWFADDMAVQVKGIVSADAKGFAINFYTGSSANGDIAFNLNPRIGQYTALNSFRNGEWESEESAHDKPFTAGTPFDMVVAVRSDNYEVHVKETQHSTFKHRIPFETVSTLGIKGDIGIALINFVKNWGKSNKSVMTGIIKQNMAVCFQGTVAAKPDRFAINFQLGPLENDEHAFHYNPRIGKYTALNSFRKGRWEKEEKASDKPFKAGGSFTVVFHFRSHGYENWDPSAPVEH
ncbi:galectin-4-like isoform X2 [Trichomycterus rosablanca]|uniref:galectin-4-like isoform X2 n=1 Tax=Trichomycterus rosablanca TaxID=2290929 RepID=UPI002F35B591